MFRNVHNKTEAIAWRTSSTHKEHVLNQVVTNKQPRALSSIEAAAARRRQLCEPTSSLMHGHLWWDFHSSKETSQLTLLAPHDRRPRSSCGITCPFLSHDEKQTD